MQIPNYQIHNVLKVYSRQVSQSRILDRRKDIDSATSVDRINISAEGQRKMIMEKVAAGIVDKITRYGPPDDPVPASGLLEEAGADPVGLDLRNGNSFVYNIIDDQNNKKTNTLPIDGSNFINHQFTITKLVPEEG